MTTDQAPELVAPAAAPLPADTLSELSAVVRTLYGAKAPTPGQMTEQVAATVTVEPQPALTPVPALASVPASLPVPEVPAPISITEAPSLQQERNSHSLLQELAFLDD